MSEDYEVNEVEEVEVAEGETPSTEGVETDTAPDYSEFLKDFKVKYDGEEVGYDDIESLRTDAQKGKNYQRMVDKVEAYKANPAYRYIDNYMKESGYKDPAKFVKDLQVNSKVAELTEKGMSEEDARKYAEQMVKEPTDVKSKEIGEFLQWHEGKVKAGVFGEGLDPESIPQEVLEAYDRGESLKEAYQDHLLKSIKQQTEQDTLKKVADNSKTSAHKIPDGQPKGADMTRAQVNKMLSQMSGKEQAKWADANMDMLERIKYFD